MKFELAKNSLFAILLRSPWWISFVIAAVLFAALRLVMPEVYAWCGALPFLVIGCSAGWKQWRAPSDGRVADALAALRAMSWHEFSGEIEGAFLRDGYAVARLGGTQADFALTRERRVSLVSCKRWKVARTGIEPLRALDAARRAREAHECIYVAAGEITDGARAFALENNIRLVHHAELAKLLPRTGDAGKVSA